MREIRRVHRGAYLALPSRRRYIPKPDGPQRPLAVAALGDKIVQRAVVAGVERDLRGRVPQVLVWVPTQARTAHFAGCSRGRDHHQKGELYS
jgi:retron-type reverse transcriptase